MQLEWSLSLPWPKQCEKSKRQRAGGGGYSADPGMSCQRDFVCVSAMKCAAGGLLCCASLYGRQMSANCRFVYLPACAATPWLPHSIPPPTLSLTLPLLLPLSASSSHSMRFSHCRRVCWGRFSSTFSECLIIKRCHVYVCVAVCVCVRQCGFGVCALTRRYTSANIWPSTHQAKPSGRKQTRDSRFKRARVARKRDLKMI